MSEGVADYLIIGGGSAGAVLASRLSENAKTRVVLVEAGRDTPPADVPADIEDIFPSSTLNPNYFWPGLRARRRTEHGPLLPFPQARVMGGGSSIMGMWALRGVESDFDAWVEAGAEGWGPADVLKYYRKLENDADRDYSQHKPGPYPIRRAPDREWPALVSAMQVSAKAQGLDRIADINEDPRPGFFAMPVSQSKDARSSSASAYLTADVRRRPNLKIMADTFVTALRFDGRRAVGAVVRRAGETMVIDAHEVILSAGAIHSPAMLLRAGIGPAEELKQLGIAALIDRPGVGRNLQNHPYVNIALTLPRHSRMEKQLRHFAVAGVRMSSGLADCPAADLMMFAMARVSGRAWGSSVAMVGGAVYRPFSRGRVRLRTADAAAAPDILFSLFQDSRDAPRLVQAVRCIESLVLETSVNETFSDAFLLPPVMAMNQFDRPGATGLVMAQTASLLLNGPASLSRWALNRALAPGRWIGNRKRRLPLADDEILSAAAPMGHVTSTCAIGRADNEMAVVDRNCRVHGLENLRVVDASIMPSVPSANTNVTTIMVAERAAELIASGVK